MVHRFSGRAGIRAQLREYLCETEAIKSLASALCDGNCLTFMLDMFIRLQLHRLCLTMTQKRNVCKRNKKLLKVSART